ncbi:MULTISPECIES: PaaI family thioesterase [Pseudomonas]|uniref:PaaI family thioesterase n=1 Tax=Pseudomonas sessilinigenes TaxID=658629 RepID=A0ABX8MWE0_9PSED|nr:MULTISPECIES: PaaI family thioesterase [Pseudomonas]QIH08853.1 PaaI family thioesterase [Pseudomonas sp. BIOMIG1BAC]QXH42927.1 PaaI family thioesterase [Pseudomonas sessilinigenes]
MQATSTGQVDRFADLLGVEYQQASFEQAVCRLRLGEAHRNALGGIHGGLVFSLADIAFAAACNAANALYIGLQAEIRYMARVQGEELMACATLVGSTKNIAHYQVMVTDSQERRIALFSATAYRLGQ